MWSCRHASTIRLVRGPAPCNRRSKSAAPGDAGIAIFDEVFRGTNVHDAMEASREVIRGCARARNSGFLFSSHLVELAEDLAAQPSVKFFCFDADILGEATVFDYALRVGVSDRRFGMELLRREGVPELLAKFPAWPIAG